MKSKIQNFFFVTVLPTLHDISMFVQVIYNEIDLIFLQYNQNVATDLPFFAKMLQNAIKLVIVGCLVLH